MEHIIIKNDGFYIKRYNDNTKQYKYVELEEDIRYYYNDFFEFEEGLTFGDLFNVLEKYVNIFDLDFMADTRKWPLQPYFDAIKKDNYLEENDKYESICFSWGSDCHTNTNRKTGKRETSLYTTMSISALGDDGSGTISNYSIGFINLCKLRDIKVVFDSKCTINEFDHDKKGYEKILEYEKETNLREFMSCLFNEITFYGSPEETKKVADQLLERVGSFDNLTEEDMEDMGKTSSFDDLRLHWLEEELQEALKEENFEWAKRTQDEIDKFKIELKGDDNG